MIMQPSVQQCVLVALTISSLLVAPTGAQYNILDVAQHSTSDSCWTVVYGDVYDVTGYGPLHPDGAESIWDMCGIDATTLYDGEHIEHPEYLDIFPGIELLGTFVDLPQHLLDDANFTFYGGNATTMGNTAMINATALYGDYDSYSGEEDSESESSESYEEVQTEEEEEPSPAAVSKNSPLIGIDQDFP